MQIGDRLRKIRKQKHITQDEMATALDMTQRAYSKIENNEVQIKLDRLDKIAKILNLDARLLLPDAKYNTFETVNYSQISCEKVINNGASKETELFERIIERQQKEINYLKELIKTINS